MGYPHCQVGQMLVRRHDGLTQGEFHSARGPLSHLKGGRRDQTADYQCVAWAISPPGPGGFQATRMPLRAPALPPMARHRRGLRCRPTRTDRSPEAGRGSGEGAGYRGVKPGDFGVAPLGRALSESLRPGLCQSLSIDRSGQELRACSWGGLRVRAGANCKVGAKEGQARMGRGAAVQSAGTKVEGGEDEEQMEKRHSERRGQGRREGEGEAPRERASVGQGGQVLPRQTESRLVVLSLAEARPGRASPTRRGRQSHQEAGRDRRTDGRSDGRTDGWRTDRWIERRWNGVNGRTDGRTERWRDRGIEGWRDGWMDGRIVG